MNAGKPCVGLYCRSRPLLQNHFSDFEVIVIIFGMDGK